MQFTLPPVISLKGCERSGFQIDVTWCCAGSVVIKLAIPVYRRDVICGSADGRNLVLFLSLVVRLAQPKDGTQ